MNVWSMFVGLCLLCPPDCRLEDRDRFPSMECAAKTLDFAKSHRTWRGLVYPLEGHRCEEWRLYNEDALWCYNCWDWLHAAQGGEKRGPDYWLYSLRKLRALIGDEAYFAGRMPPPMPVWWYYSYP